MKTLNLRNSFIVIAAMAIVVFAAGSALSWRFGTECAQGYQNNWQHYLPYSWARCSGFNNELDDTDTKVFYYDLNGAKPYWENTRDQYELETVNLIFANTHGGAWTNSSVWAMWNQGQFAYSSNMRLGDEALGLSILATYACQTMKMSDGRMWVRLGPIMRGGLRYIAGSHGSFWAGWTTDECGEDFADYLQRGYSLKNAWKNGVSDWYFDQDAAVMATGSSSYDAVNRRDGMSWRNFNSFPRLRDSQIRNYAWWYWNNL